MRRTQSASVNPYTDRAVLVVGGLGFIGVNLTARLAESGAVLCVLTPTLERHAQQASSFDSRGIRIVDGDVRDPHVM